MGNGLLEGRELGLIWVVPFAGLLLSIALLPWLMPQVWHRHFGKIATAWALAFLGPCMARFGIDTTAGQVARVELLDFIPFLILVGALYTVTGGVRVIGTIRGTPLTNTLILASGTLLASIMGTTGAAMLLIRPLLRANERRRYRAHVIIFYIILVGNIGGALSPLGDPPLLIGFLEGVDFFWPLHHLAAPTALLVSILLTLFWVIDHQCWRQEPPEVTARPPSDHHEPLRIEGWSHLLLLLPLIGALTLQSLWHPGHEISIVGVEIPIQVLVAQALLLVITALSLYLTTTEHRRLNAFSWAPMIDVATLFGALFITIVPALAILHAGRDGAAAGFLAALDNNGRPVAALYFWATGLCSSVLDNAPTYLIFFHAAGGNAQTLMTTDAPTLTAISAGAVFMGALTYIGNVPNFLIKAIAEESGVSLPGFFGYSIGSSCLLLPLFGLLAALYFS